MLNSEDEPRPITMKEVKDAIRRMKNGKSPGYDGPAEIFKAEEDVVR